VPPEWPGSKHDVQAQYRSLLDYSKRFMFPDAAQLVKHYLGVRNTINNQSKLILMYLFWESDNAKDVEEFSQHRDEDRVFADEVKGSEVSFIAMSYPELWASWSANTDWLGMQSHLQSINGRYSYSL